MREGRGTVQLHRARAEVAASIHSDVLIRLMHETKGQEYRALAMIACDVDVFPSEEHLMSARDERAQTEVYDTERNPL